MAATLGKTSIGKLNRRNVLKADIGKLCGLVSEPAEPLALRLSSNLLVGVARVYKVKHDIFLSEVTTCFTSLKRTLLEISAAETSAALNLPFGSVRPDTITLAAPELGIGMNLDIDFGGPVCALHLVQYTSTNPNYKIWEDFFTPLANSTAFTIVLLHLSTNESTGGLSPGITSQDFGGTETQTQTQRPLYTLDEEHADLLAANDPEAADPVDLGLGLGLEEFDLGLGQDAFGDPLPLEDIDLVDIDSPTKQKQKIKPKSTAGAGAGIGTEPMYAREPSAPIDQLNFDDWALGIEPSSSGFDLPGSGGPGLPSSRPGSRFQSREPQAAGGGQLQHPPEGAVAAEGGERAERDEGEHVPAAPKKPKKQKGVVQDTRTELREDELTADNYAKEQKRLRIEIEIRRQERDAVRVIDVWMEGVPYGFNCPALDDWFKQSFKALVSENSHRRKRDEDDVFAAPPLPAKRRREETPSQGPEIGRQVGTPMDFGDEYNWGGGTNFGADLGIPRGSSVEAAEMGMHASRAASQARDDVNVSQRSSLLPWDNMGVSSSTNGDAGPVNLPGSEGGRVKVDHVTVKLRGSSQSRRESSAAPSRLSASPGRFGPGLEAFGGDAFEFPATAGERPSQLEVTMERNSFKFFEYVRMQERALADSSGGVMFSSIVPAESSTAHVAAMAFYHTLVLATKSAVRVRQGEPFVDFSIQTL
ncbi:hypothetical protein FRC10_005369 [Ceratobasidium sp. 414]|nr:hypothetical protein FRC10_005369 [Ceratobasidium sp. 414]